MKKKILILLLFFLGFFTLSKPKFNTIKVKAEEANNSGVGLKIGDDKYVLPVTVYIAAYCWEDDEVFIQNNFTVTGKYRGITTNHTVSAVFTIIEEEDIDYLNKLAYEKLYGTIDEEAYDLKGEECLPCDFFIVSYDPNLFIPGETLEGTTEAELLENYDVHIYTSTDGYDGFFSKCDYLSPVLENEEKVIITDYDDPISVEDIKSKIKAIDATDGDLTDSIVIEEDNYTDCIDGIGEYDVTFSVTDSSRNKATLKVLIEVADITDPIISGPDVLNFTTNSPKSVAQIKNMFTYTDNYDESEDLIDNVEIEENYTDADNMPGTYNLTITLTDSSGNESTKTLNIIVKDDTKPVITGTNKYTKSASAELKVSEIMAGLVATDNVNGDVSNSLTVKTDNYSKNSTKIGTFTISFVAFDAAKNSSDEFIVTIEINDTLIPIFYVDNSFMSVSSFEKLSHQDIIDFLEKTNAIDEENVEEVSVKYDSYSENYDKKGVYEVKLNVKYKNKQSEDINVTIRVHEENEVETPIEKIEEKLSFFDRIRMFFIRIFNYTVDFFAMIIAFLYKIFNK